MKRTAIWSLLFIGVLAVGLPARSDDPALRERARAALRKAVEFYRTKVSTEGGYHFQYAEDLSYGRSEMSEGPTRVEIQRDGTPLVGMAYLDAYEATRDGYYLEAAREVARALVRGQYCSGGWDYFIEFDSQKRAQYPYRVDGRCGQGSSARPERQTTLDDNITQAAVRLLMRVDRDLDFTDTQIHEAARFALDSLIKAQYPNGAWPQRYSRFPAPKSFPVTRASYAESWPRRWPGSDYRAHYTFNDDSIVDMIDAMLEAARIYREPRYLASAENGGAFIQLAQMPEPQPGWAQQYDRDMHPAWARVFEPPSITGGESQSVMKGLLLLFRETGKRKYLEPLPRALAYYRRSILPDVASPSEIRRRACPNETPCLARFAELKTNRPLYITKGTRVTALDKGTTNVDGYEVSHSDQSVITHYSVLVSGAGLAGLEQEYRELQNADPVSLKRLDRLHGLSPWSGRSAPVGSETRVGTVIDAMDPRGAWVEEGSIGKANRLVSVFASQDMVVTLAGKSLPMKENDTLEVFVGAEPPKERIIRTRTFVENIAALSAYLAPQTPIAACERLATLVVPTATITMAQTVQAGTFTPPGAPDDAAFRALPAFCRVAATLKPSSDSDIKIEVWMPAAVWNGKFQAVGNGAFNGTINYAAMRTALARGYATSSTDTGHTGGGASWALGHPEKVVDFGWRAIHEMTTAAKRIIASYYDRGATFSYWNGCSAGGRQGMKAAQRFPDDFDGIIAGAPGLDWMSRAAQSVRIAKVLESHDAARLPQTHRQLLHTAVVGACDALDGVTDGLIENPPHCTFDPAILECKDSTGAGCLTKAQVETARLMYSSPINPKTGRVIAGLAAGSELGWTDLGWTASARATGLDQFRFIVYGDPNWTIQRFDVDADIVRAEETDRETIDARDPNLQRFFDRGGKLIQYHGWSDPQISPLNSTQYYSRVLTAIDDASRVHGSYRLFMAPGMAHCGGGEGPNTFDMVSALEQWVEHGKAPDRIIASHSTGGIVDRTRPLCPYPQVAAYRGTGSTDEAANFVCKAP